MELWRKFFLLNFTYFSHFHTILVETRTLHVAGISFLRNPDSQMEQDLLGQIGTSLGQNGSEIRDKMAYFNKHMRQ